MYWTDNAICCGTRMYGTVYRVPDTTDLYSLFEWYDIATITVNYQQNRIKFYSDIKGLSLRTNCVRSIEEFVSYDASMTILRDESWINIKFDPRRVYKVAAKPKRIVANQILSVILC